MGTSIFQEEFIMKRIAIVGNYLPRKCGIATFTTDLCESLAAEYADAVFFAVPVNDIEAGYNYPPRVRFELRQNDLASYRQAADFLNINKVNLVCLQHEFGLYGGTGGEPRAFASARSADSDNHHVAHDSRQTESDPARGDKGDSRTIGAYRYDEQQGRRIPPGPLRRAC
jgi:hypothetical protein